MIWKWSTLIAYFANSIVNSAVNPFCTYMYAIQGYTALALFIPARWWWISDGGSFVHFQCWRLLRCNTCESNTLALWVIK
jgi:hypothetical protein